MVLARMRTLATCINSLMYITGDQAKGQDRCYLEALAPQRSTETVHGPSKDRTEHGDGQRRAGTRHGATAQTRRHTTRSRDCIHQIVVFCAVDANESSSS
eukprot:gnl/TRDRNA2_/TRDRNA2_149569_c0_seq1.p1 gnl/TRDRNA2_/TRDRNA2_149569_c0~~gnl/TRDRNA2_/TRDRNA2_149569_c0_seq1.p1  ORF type:complete len:100 (-),score=1.28 gnl/TRDRNA2_/TRDRNA2_149569_c0_seq1:50-349(-)